MPTRAENSCTRPLRVSASASSSEPADALSWRRRRRALRDPADLRYRLGDLLHAGRLPLASFVHVPHQGAQLRGVRVSACTDPATWSSLLLPSFDVAMDSSISPAVSLAAAAQRCARLRTSSATTANPRPAEPARAASTAAFKRQDVGLKRDFVDGFDNARDLIARRVDVPHRNHHFIQHVVGQPHHLLGFPHQVRHGADVFRIAAGHGGDLGGGVGSAFQGGSLLGGALRQRMAGAGDLRGRARHARGALRHATRHARQQHRLPGKP